MSTTHGWLLFGLLLSSIAGCSGATTSDDAAIAPDAFATDAAHVADTGIDARAPIDASDVPDATADAFVTNDAFVASDAGRDAFVASDAGHDAFIGHDAGHDAAVVGCAGCNTAGGMACAYAIADGCSAAPECVMIPTPSGCGAIVLEMGCGCDGSAVMWRGGCRPDLPNGYAPAPITHMGACP